MFYYKKNKNKIYIWSDEIKGKFGPFIGAFVKNKFLGNFEKKYKNLQEKYEIYKYSIGIGDKKIFIIGQKGIEKILEKN